MDHARLSIFFESIGESEIHNGIAIWNCLIWTNSDMAMVSLKISHRVQDLISRRQG